MDINWFEQNFVIVNSIPQLKEVLKDYEDCSTITLDTEFTDLRYYYLELIGLSFFAQGKRPVYIQFNFTGKYYLDGRDPKNKRKKIKLWQTYKHTGGIGISEAKPILKKFLKGKDIVGANLKADIKALYKYGLWDFETMNVIEDTMAQLYCIDPSPAHKKGLKDGVYKYLGYKMDSYEDTVLATKKKGELNINWHQVDWQQYGRYGALDSFATYYLCEKLQNIQPDTPHYRETEIPLIPVNAKMEIDGVYIDIPYLKKLEREIDAEIAQREKEIYNFVGIEFNINSNDQLGDVLFNKLKYPVISKTGTGKNSTDTKTLEELAYRGYKLADMLLRYSALKKLKTTYISALPDKVDTDGRLRANFNAMLTVTNRFSSSAPNLQNIPSREKKYLIRKAFKPEKGKAYAGADFGQLELRMMAHACKDEALIDAYMNNKDIHQMTTDNVNKLGLNISRSEGKTTNFSVLYGMGAKALAYTLNMNFKNMVHDGDMTEKELKEKWVTNEAAQKMIDGFYSLYHGYASKVQQETAKAKRLGYAETLSGFRRYIPELRSRKTFYQGQRYVASTLIQGSAASLVKNTMVKIDKELRREGIEFKMVLNVHDELVVEVSKSYASKAAEIMQKCGETVWEDFLVPLDFEADVYSNWHELKTGKQKETVIKKMQKWGILTK
jgi:DNA polymerase-1